MQGKVLESDVETYEKSDGATVRINGGTNTSFGAIVDIEDHINKQVVQTQLGILNKWK